ncbi:MAG: hypothetical protein JJ902_01605 [Roseibium sp.]|nr:hypothetical protein [Roseibium sp.]
MQDQLLAFKGKAGKLNLFFSICNQILTPVLDRVDLGATLGGINDPV